MNKLTESSEPYLTGMGLRKRCHLIYDEFQQDPPEYIQNNGDVAFVKTDHIHHFFEKVVPLIKYKFKLITHNSDLPINEDQIPLLNHPNLTKWYAQNVDVYHSKLTSIPIGIANARWKHGDISMFKEVESMHTEKTNLLYCNFDSTTNQSRRSQLYDQFSSQDFAYISQRKTFKEYLTDIKSSHYVLSPNGNGIDCHRTWESILMGAIPIVEQSINSSFYLDCSIMIVKSFNLITKDFLLMSLNNYRSMQNNVLYLNYWLDKIFR